MKMSGSFCYNMLMLLALLCSFELCLCMLCVDKPNGVYEANCHAYTICIDGMEEIVNCESGQAFNSESKQCEIKWDVPPPCGTYRECSDKSNGFYPDPETKCHSYYVCNNGMFVGHSLCPAGLVYNVFQGVCDYAYNAPPPCGTNKTIAMGLIG